MTKHTNRPCLFFLLSAALLTASMLLSGCGKKPATEKKVIILGIDGMDPGLLAKFVSQGKMPHFSSLIQKGSFRALRTSIPPQSPVAWSNFITGKNPGGHGIFDFIHRDPDTLVPYLSTSKTEAPEKTIGIGKYRIPLSQGKVTLLRKGTAFWEILERYAIPTTIYKIPSNYPPVQTKFRTISGMGTPDVLGSYGTFSFYTDDASDIEISDEMGGGELYEVWVFDDRVETELHGPRNTLVKDSPETTIPFTVSWDPEYDVAKIDVQNNELVLEKGEWSDWVRVKFSLVKGVSSVSGICRFYLKQLRPTFELYVSPINIDPLNPAVPISTPDTYSKELAEHVGLFYTQTMPEDTKALSGGVLNVGEYLEQSLIVLDERLRAFDYEMDRFESGVLFFYFSSLDQNSHALWWTWDKNHPRYDPEVARMYSKSIEQLYTVMDSVLAKTQKILGPDDTLLIMSDHGFAPFYYGFNLNTWLLHHGYIALNDPSLQEEGELFWNVDWTRTSAYGFGLNGLYLNLKGREYGGIVEPGEQADGLRRELRGKLLEVTDPATGEHVISSVYIAQESYSGDFTDEAPDLIIGYKPPYRASWKTVLGEFPRKLIETNMDTWSGDHCADPNYVPGVVLSNRKIVKDDPALYDLFPTVLAEFGIAPPDDIVGKDIFLREEEQQIR